jgi:hypothetical protein
MGREEELRAELERARGADPGAAFDRDQAAPRPTGEDYG